MLRAYLTVRAHYNRYSLIFKKVCVCSCSQTTVYEWWRT